MKKLTQTQLYDLFYEHNVKNNITSQFEDEHPLIGVVVYKAGNWKTEYSLESRSYKVRSDNKAFIPGMCGNSIYADNLDKSDHGVRLDWYGWAVDYCYLLED